MRYLLFLADIVWVVAYTAVVVVKHNFFPISISITPLYVSLVIGIILAIVTAKKIGTLNGVFILLTCIQIGSAVMMIDRADPLEDDVKVYEVNFTNEGDHPVEVKFDGFFSSWDIDMLVRPEWGLHYEMFPDLYYYKYESCGKTHRGFYFPSMRQEFTIPHCWGSVPMPDRPPPGNELG